MQVTLVGIPFIRGEYSVSIMLVGSICLIYFKKVVGSYYEDPV